MSEYAIANKIAESQSMSPSPTPAQGKVSWPHPWPQILAASLPQSLLAVQGDGGVTEGLAQLFVLWPPQRNPPIMS